MHVSNQIPKTFQIGTKNKIKKIWYYQSTYGPDRLELIIDDITNKKICNHPCRL